MSEPIGEDNIREYLTAFADGELDAARILTVLDYLALHPEALEMMRVQQRLRLAAERAVRGLSPPTPEALRRQLEAMTPDLPPATASPIARVTHRWWMMPIIAAALLVGGMLAGHFIVPPRSTHSLVQGPDAVPDDVVAHASRIHADCSRLADALHSAGYPKELAGLALLVKSELKSEYPYPDLSAIGFRLVGAGPCADPMADTAHLLYRSTGAGHESALSVFVQPYKGQFALEKGKFYVVSGPRSPFPVHAWRTSRLVYFLIADDEAVEAKARATLATAIGL